jgi:magnesium-transporting ATPase (P-type)
LTDLRVGKDNRAPDRKEGSMTNVNWERWARASGIAFAVLFIISYLIYGDQPEVGASADELASFYFGDRGRILTASVLFSGAVLFLLWFAAAIASTLRDAGLGGWAAATTASSAALAAVFFVLITLSAALAYSITGSNAPAITAALNDLAWACLVTGSFPAAMLIMAGTFGLRRAGILSDALWLAGVLATVLVLLGGTTWATDGFWAPDGAYSRFIEPIVALAWVVVVSWLLYARGPSTPRTPQREATPAP